MDCSHAYTCTPLVFPTKKYSAIDFVTNRCAVDTLAISIVQTFIFAFAHANWPLKLPLPLR